jgi:hypothetical protein
MGSESFRFCNLLQPAVFEDGCRLWRLDDFAFAEGSSLFFDDALFLLFLLLPGSSDGYI